MNDIVVLTIVGIGAICFLVGAYMLFAYKALKIVERMREEK